MVNRWRNFFTFIEKCLIPKLTAGKIILLDNVAFHKAFRIKEAIEAVGAKLKFLPPYSPDFPPIENMWSKIKTVLRKFSPRTLNEFKKAIKKAFASISTTDLLAWFRHCGYNI
jgi:transposase